VPVGLEGDRVGARLVAEIDEGLAAGAEGRIEIARGAERDAGRREPERERQQTGEEPQPRQSANL
jgi:hypothetical protein